MTDVDGIILAAGASRRLGRPKQLLELDGRRILDIVLHHAKLSRLRNIYLVLGSNADRISAAVSDHGQRTVVNHDFAAGQSTSLLAGMLCLPQDTAAALVLLGDQPQVTPTIIDRLIVASETDAASIIMPSYGGTPGNPVLFRRAVFPALLAITGDRGARDVINARRDSVTTVPFPTMSPPLDVDTEDDYATLQRAWAADRHDMDRP